ncbi:hypothetical protein CSI00_20715 [Klebsiella pneumoniae]|nr:hypothetical protein [Klebsiella pneumoniae]
MTALIIYILLLFLTLKLLKEYKRDFIVGLLLSSIIVLFTLCDLYCPVMEYAFFILVLRGILYLSDKVSLLRKLTGQHTSLL